LKILEYVTIHSDDVILTCITLLLSELAKIIAYSENIDAKSSSANQSEIMDTFIRN
jgi:hypothetical protein